MFPLPIEESIPALLDAVRRSPLVVLQAPPGAGKTTRVPTALLESGCAREGEILVSEPRRLAARLAAQHVAELRGEPVGATIGYSVRFEERASARTRIRFVTTGVLSRRLSSLDGLAGVSVVLLDEFHERQAATDVTLALLRRHISLHGTPRVVIMSATINGAGLAERLGCPWVETTGRSFETQITYSPDDERPLEKRCALAVKDLWRASDDRGDALVFLPGAREIGQVEALLEPFARAEGARVLPLHGDLQLDAQARAVRRSETRKIVLSTNVAETSVTIDGVTMVVDSGLARVAGHSPWSGRATLTLRPISRASADQRAGRAGRTAPGRVVRLYSAADYRSRAAADVPELLRCDLTELVLLLHTAGVTHPADLQWLDAPAPAALDAAETLLRGLGAIDTEGHLTELGARLSALPLHPRLGRTLVSGVAAGVRHAACVAAALLGERDIRRAERDARHRGRAPSDVEELIELFDEAASARFSKATLRAIGLDATRVSAVERSRLQLSELTRGWPHGAVPADPDAALRRALLAGFFDRVAKRRRVGEPDVILQSGAVARLDARSVVHDAELMLALDVRDHSVGGRGGPVVYLASALESDWLLEDFTDGVGDSDVLEWSDDRQCVLRVSRMTWGSVVLEESRGNAEPSLECSLLLTKHALKRLADLCDPSDIEQLRLRLQLLTATLPDLGPDEVDVEAAMAAVCDGATSFDDIRRTDLISHLTALLPRDLARALEQDAPRKVRLPHGRDLRVTYHADGPPSCASRIQDFFGTATGPTVFRGRVPVVLHLLAPNQRPVQVTNDLAGFWERHYPALRRELGRRYPKHAWPEDPRRANPPQPRPPPRRS